MEIFKLISLLSLFLFVGCADEAQKEITTIEPGATAPSFNLKNIDGQLVSPESYPDAKGFIVVFTANTCPIAKKYEDRLIALGKNYNFKGYPVIAINANTPGLLAGDGYEKMQKRAKTKGFTFPYLYDEGQKVTDQYGARVTPHVFLLKREGSGLKVVYTGAIDNDIENENPDKTLFVENAITSLEAGKQIEVASTKAIGCAVKR
ncbi:thioredoxin family protein [Pontibacter toksunensis]|uniref:Thioredoxin family protein n=1 Tax=Pontibacter toksunensis TaxID=1332631 RepID=A0ABW6C174_9BACT